MRQAPAEEKKTPSLPTAQSIDEKITLSSLLQHIMELNQKIDSLSA